MVKVNVKYFGVLSEITGKSEENRNINGSINNLITELTEEYPEIGKHNFAVSTNQTISSENPPLQENDQIALLPPFAGG